MNVTNHHFLKRSTQPVRLSGPASSLVRTNTEGWQITCWDLTKANQRFQLHGYRKQHKTFVEELAFTYGYHLETVGGKIVFCPTEAPNQNRL